MLKFISDSTVPPGSKYFFQISALRDYGYKGLPETANAKFEHVQEATVKAMVKDYLRRNGLEVPENLGAMIRDYICRASPQGFCHGESDLPTTKFISKSQIAEGTKLLFNKVRMSEEDFYVSQEEADRRARICADCPFNLRGICVSCTSTLGDLASRLISNRKSQFESHLDTCAHCGCALRAKVFISIKALAITQKHPYPTWCWMSGTACDSEVKAVEVSNG